MKKKLIIFIFLLSAISTQLFAITGSDKKAIDKILSKVGIKNANDSSIIAAWVIKTAYRYKRRTTRTTTHSLILKKDQSFYFYSCMNTLKDKKTFVNERKLEWNNILQTYKSIRYPGLTYSFKDHKNIEIIDSNPELNRKIKVLKKTSLLADNIEKIRKAKLQHSVKCGTLPGVIKIGMSKEDVLQVGWGKPVSINRTRTISGINEQWVYRRGYLYFENGILVTIQD